MSTFSLLLWSDCIFYLLRIGSKYPGIITWDYLHCNLHDNRDYIHDRYCTQYEICPPECPPSSSSLIMEIGHIIFVFYIRKRGLLYLSTLKRSK